MLENFNPLEPKTILTAGSLMLVAGFWQQIVWAFNFLVFTNLIAYE